MKSNFELYTESFSSSVKWRKWLSQNHEKQEGVWLSFYEKDSKVKSHTRVESLDEALAMVGSTVRENLMTTNHGCPIHTTSPEKRLVEERQREC